MQEQPQAERHEHRYDQHGQLVVTDVHAKDVDEVVRRKEGRDESRRAGIPEVVGGADYREHEAEGDTDGGDDRRSLEPAHKDPLDHRPGQRCQHKHDRHDGRDGRPPQGDVQRPVGERRHHADRSVGEVEHA